LLICQAMPHLVTRRQSLSLGRRLQAGQRAGSNSTLTASVRRESFNVSTAWSQHSSRELQVLAWLEEGSGLMAGADFRLGCNRERASTGQRILDPGRHAEDHFGHS
jgi:hypothetical protein